MRWTNVTILIIFSVLATHIRGEAGAALCMVLFCFEMYNLFRVEINCSLCYPTILVLGLAGLGKYMKRSGGMIVLSIVGEACFP